MDLVDRRVIFCAGCKGLVIRFGVRLQPANDRAWPILDEMAGFQQVPHE